MHSTFFIEVVLELGADILASFRLVKVQSS